MCCDDESVPVVIRYASPVYIVGCNDEPAWTDELQGGD